METQEEGVTANSPLISVIGTASLDVVHLAQGKTVEASGGAGLYTALAAYRAGANVILFAPRPQPMPPGLQPVADVLQWEGPLIPPEQLPRLEIAHHGNGTATLLQASWGAEAALRPELLPAALLRSAYVHIAALSSARRQLDFLARLQEQRLKISVGTYAKLVYQQTAQVGDLFEAADCFFMNENEARGLFGSIEQAQTKAGRLLFITRAAGGVVVVTGEEATPVRGWPAVEIDPTGAGDTFCGATLAGLAQGMSPLAAAGNGVRMAARAVEVVGAFGM